MDRFICFRMKNRRDDDLIINPKEIESISPGDKKDYYMITMKTGEIFEVNISYESLIHKLNHNII